MALERFLFEKSEVLVMQIKLLKDIVSSIVGLSASRIVDLLYEKKNVNEFIIAKSLKLTINQTRNILYKLADEGLVSFVRKKDRKKGGWYIYFWTLNSGKSLLKFKQNIVKERDNFKEQRDVKKSKQFYYCRNDSIEFSDEVALLNQYICPECGEVLNPKDQKADIDDLEKKLVKLDILIMELNKEIEDIQEKENKVLHRKLRAEVKKKVKERLLRKKEREKLAKKEKKEKKHGKKLKRKKSR